MHVSFAECNEKLALENGQVELPDTPIFESEVHFSCDSGYVLDGPESAACTSDGTWAETMTRCKPIGEYTFSTKDV